MLRWFGIGALLLSGCWNFSEWIDCRHCQDASFDTDLHEDTAFDMGADLFGLLASTNKGWSDIQALGRRVPVGQSILGTVERSIALQWNTMTVNQGSHIDGYNIYRSVSSGAQDFSAPLNTVLIDASTPTYTDSNVVGNAIYYYVAAPVLNGAVAIPSTSPTREVKVVVPPNNMVLVHRWIANQEMCGLMQKPTDAANNYRCDYPGTGGDGLGHFDIGASFFVDANELGCNYTPEPACATANGCLGTADPGTGTGSVGNIFYNRSNGNCWYKTTATTWLLANDPGLVSNQLAQLASNQPGLPPLINIDQARSSDSCSALIVSGFSGTKKLLTHREQVIAAAWSPAFTDQQISTFENGMNLPTSGYCNANQGDQLLYDDNVFPANLETLPGTLSSSIRLVRTGSGQATRNCLSRYGAQDLVGNVAEWSSDQLGTCSSSTHACSGIASTLDSSNTDWNGFNFDGTIGPGGNTTTTTWSLSATSFDATRFLVPLGLPMVTAAAVSWGSTPIGTGLGSFDPAKFHNNRISLYPDIANGTPTARGAIAGGSAIDQSSVGRFTVDLEYPPSSFRTFIGLRCALAAE